MFGFFRVQFRHLWCHTPSEVVGRKIRPLALPALVLLAVISWLVNFLIHAVLEFSWTSDTASRACELPAGSCKWRSWSWSALNNVGKCISHSCWLIIADLEDTLRSLITLRNHWISHAWMHRLKLWSYISPGKKGWGEDILLSYAASQPSFTITICSFWMRSCKATYFRSWSAFSRDQPWVFMTHTWAR
jgi:hypothetical protein